MKMEPMLGVEPSPLPYQGSALPLSYTGMVDRLGLEPSMSCLQGIPGHLHPGPTSEASMKALRSVLLLLACCTTTKPPRGGGRIGA